MTAPVIGTGPARPAPPPWGPGARRAGWILLLGWALLLGGAVLLGERSSSFADLERAVASGEVQVVEVAGGLTPGARGFSVAEVHWRDGMLGYSTQVVETRSRRAARQRSAGDEITAVLSEDVGARLAASQPGLRVVRVDRSATSTALLGWRLPGWMAWPTLLLCLSTLGLLMVGPRPWRATRWAWFWVLGMVPPVGFLAFLLLSGATSLVPPPRDAARRLTGGWAFLLCVVVGTALGRPR